MVPEILQQALLLLVDIFHISYIACNPWIIGIWNSNIERFINTSAE